MLWFDSDRAEDTATKIQNACAYYEKKWGRKPDLVLLHPSMLEGGALEGSTFSSDGLTIRPYRPVLPGHIWVGIADKGDV
jgi:hypothetical protein